MLALSLIVSQYPGFSQEETNGQGHWEEGVFARHFLVVPMFLILKTDLVEQIRLANASQPISLAEPSKRWPIRLPEPPLLPFSSLAIPYFWIPLFLSAFN